MRRGELYRVFRPGGDPEQTRTFAIASRQVLLNSRFSTVVCAPVFSAEKDYPRKSRSVQKKGLKHHSWIMCDNLVSIRQSDLTNYVGALSRAKLQELNQALKRALDLA